jgi:diketogulonate reductase-like aldo/keto reductase
MPNPTPNRSSVPLEMPRLGLGTWRMGERASARAAEVAAVRLALDIGYRLVDTAEMYGEGGAEEVVGQALAEALRAGAHTRESVCIVSKAYPHHASRRELPAACDRSRRRLGVDRIDVYLLHWRGDVPLQETVDAMEDLVERGRIGRWGVSNFDTDDMAELVSLPGGRGCATNQVYYSLGERGPEYGLLPWQRERSLPLMAYSPIDQGALAEAPVLHEIGSGHGADAAQVALAWVCAQAGVVAIPKAVRAEHLRANWAAQDLRLTPEDLARLDAAFPPPRRKQRLAMI